VHIIKENSLLVGLPRHFTIFDRGDSKKAVKDAIEELSLDPKQVEPGSVLNAISRVRRVMAKLRPNMRDRSVKVRLNFTER
jgi:DNA helicase-2/ATP-dependent DNA helicase PcrA